MNKVCSIDSGIISPFALQKIDDNDSEEIPLKIGRTVVGRDDTSNIIIESMFCSRQHCILDVQDTEVVLIDCVSKHANVKFGLNFRNILIFSICHFIFHSRHGAPISMMLNTNISQRNSM